MTSSAPVLAELTTANQSVDGIALLFDNLFVFICFPRSPAEMKKEKLFAFFLLCDCLCTMDLHENVRSYLFADFPVERNSRNNKNLPICGFAHRVYLKYLIEIASWVAWCWPLHSRQLRSAVHFPCKDRDKGDWRC